MGCIVWWDVSGYLGCQEKWFGSCNASLCYMGCGVRKAHQHLERLQRKNCPWGTPRFLLDRGKEVELENIEDFFWWNMWVLEVMGRELWESLKQCYNCIFLKSGFFFFFWPCCEACGILVPWAVRVLSPNHWTTRELPGSVIFKIDFYMSWFS